MPTVLPEMGLIIWDQEADNFSHTDLQSNFEEIDLHDHSMGHGVQVGTPGLQSGAVTNAILASNAVDNSKIANGTIAVTKFASPLNTAYRYVDNFRGMLTNALSGGPSQVYLLLGGSSVPVASGTGVTANSLASTYIKASDQNVNGLTTNFSFRYNMLAGAFDTLTVTLGLYPITNATGNPSGVIYQIGSAVPGSQVSFGISNGGVQSGIGPDFTIASDGIYAPGFTVSARPAVNHYASLAAHLVVHNV